MTVITHPVTRWVVGIFLIYYVLTDPSGAAGTFHALLGLAHSAGNSLSAFASDLH